MQKKILLEEKKSFFFELARLNSVPARTAAFMMLQCTHLGTKLNWRAAGSLPQNRNDRSKSSRGERNHRKILIKNRDRETVPHSPSTTFGLHLETYQGEPPLFHIAFTPPNTIWRRKVVARSFGRPSSG